MDNEPGELNPTLFLHMGPGLHAHVEETLLSTHFPNHHFWNQPLMKEQEGAFEGLISAAEKELKRLCEFHQSSVCLKAHSFGGHLIRPLLKRVPELISSCHLVSTAYDTPGSYLNLLRKLSLDSKTEHGLKRELEAFLNVPRSDAQIQNSFWEIIALIIKDPMFARLYWPTQKSFESYLDIAKNFPAIDMTTFQVITNDFLNNYFDKEAPYEGSCRVLIELGALDPFLVLDREEVAWRLAFPKALIQIKNKSGHFIHLENYL
jgi:pimeloyl-ACP methyl ester carboxylesterase